MRGRVWPRVGPTLIQEAADTAITQCKATGRRVTAEVTTTYAEVDRVQVEGAPDLECCVRGALWPVEFPPGQHRLLSHAVERDPT